MLQHTAKWMETANSSNKPTGVAPPATLLTDDASVNTLTDDAAANSLTPG
jgi:hypothetical protein